MNRLRDIGPTRLLPYLVIILIAMAYTVSSGMIPRYGDDAYYTTAISSLSDFPTYAQNHWNHHNGRLADISSTIYLNEMFSPWLRVIINGVLNALLMFAAIRAARIPSTNPLGRLVMILLITFTTGIQFLWMEYVCFMNYTWAAALVLGALCVAIQGDSRKGGWWRWCLLPVFVIIGGWHEASAIILVTGIPAYFIVSKEARHLAPARKALLIALLLGTIIPLAAPFVRGDSPALYHYDHWRVLLTSGFYPILLIITSIILYIFRREMFMKLFRSSWIIYLVGSVMSLAVLWAANYPGRPGWFGQVFGLVGLARIATISIRIPRGYVYNIATWILAIGLAAQYICMAWWQYKLGSESRSMVTAFQTTGDPIVYMDYTEDEDVPLNVRYMVRGIPDPDDIVPYLTSLYYGYNGFIPVVVLPEAAKDLDMSHLKKPARFGRYIISPVRIEGGKDNPNTKLPCYIVEIEGVDYIETSYPIHSDRPGMPNGPVAFLYSPVHIDPGQM